MIHLNEVIADLVGRIAVLEDKENMEEEKTTRKTRSNTTTDPDTAEKLQQITKTQKALEDRVEDVECIVQQLNDPSTQPTCDARAPPNTTSDIKKLTTKIEGVEKQLHAAIGAKHK